MQNPQRSLCAESLAISGIVCAIVGTLVVGVQVLWFLGTAEWPDWSLLDPLTVSPILVMVIGDALPGLLWLLESAPLGAGLIGLCLVCWVGALFA